MNADDKTEVIEPAKPGKTPLGFADCSWWQMVLFDAAVWFPMLGAPLLWRDVLGIAEHPVVRHIDVHWTTWLFWGSISTGTLHYLILKLRQKSR